MLERLFRSNAEVSILNTVLFTDDLHLREVARRADVSPYEAKRELDNLVDLGILNSKKKGNQIFFYANIECSFLEDLRNLFKKTEGIITRIRTKIKNLDGIRYCIVYGSVASGRLSEKSDTDLLIIGSVDEDKLDYLVLQLQQRTKREINYILWSEKDLRNKLKNKSVFLKNILTKKFIWIIGDKDGFIRIAKKTYGSEN